MTLRIREIDHVVLRAIDLEAMTDFYRKVLGMDLVALRPEFGMAHLRAGRSMLDLVDAAGPLGKKGGHPPGQEGKNLDHLCLRVEPFDLDEILRELAAHGVQPEGEARRRFGAEGTGMSLYLKDPEGNVVELKGPSDGSAVPEASS